MTEDQQQLLAFMEKMKTLKTPCMAANEFLYKGIEHFLLEHGRWYTPEPWTGKYMLGAPKQCFGNALILGATASIRYVEGLATIPELPFPVHHAWNLDQRGVLVDNTWCNTGVLYLGVEFSLGRADDAIWNGDSNVLDDYQRGHPIFRQPWTGEDASLQWPCESLLLLRRALDGDEGARATLAALNRLEESREDLEAQPAQSLPTLA
jgi:hypothetical protein